MRGFYRAGAALAPDAGSTPFGIACSNHEEPMAIRTGTLLVGLGAFKIAVGVGVYFPEVQRIFGEGGVATVSDQSVGAVAAARGRAGNDQAQP